MKSICLKMIIPIVITIMNVNCQVSAIYNFLEIKSFINPVDSSFIINIKNISDSSLIFNAVEPSLYPVNDSILRANLCLFSDDLSIHKPGDGDIMYLKTLYPNMTWTLTSKRQKCDINLKPFLQFELQYVVVPVGMLIRDYVVNSKLKIFMKRQKYSMFKYVFMFNVSDLLNMSTLKLESVKVQKMVDW